MAAFTAANLAGKTSNSMVRRWAGVVWSWLFDGVWSFGLDDGAEKRYISYTCLSLLPFMVCIDGPESGFLVNNPGFSII